jgi:hypothetical protein
MENYFDIVPEELNYIIVSKLDYTSSEIFKKFMNINFSYEILFEFRYPLFYPKVKEIIIDDKKLNNRFKDYIYIIFDIMYKDLLKIFATEYLNNPIVIMDSENMSNLDKLLYNGIITIGHIETRISGEVYRNNLNSITVDVIDLIKLKSDFPQIYWKLNWFPIYTLSIYEIHASLIKIHNFILNNSSENIDNLRNYLETGRVTEKINYNDDVSNAIRLFGPQIIIIYLIINEYLKNDAPIFFNENVLNYWTTTVFGIPDLSDIIEYLLHLWFYSDLINFIKINRSKLNYI